MEIDEIYISLIVRQLKKEASGIEKKKLFEWIYSNPEHEKIYYLLKDIWETSRYEQIAGEAMTDSEWEKLALKAIETESGHYIKKQKNIRRLYRAIQIAAILVLAIGLGFFLNRMLPHKQELVSVNVPYGAKTNIELPDGSKVWVNSGSRFTYPAHFNGKNIDMRLDGQAFFDIVHNPKRRINIHTASVTVQVLGTVFNVKSYKDEEVFEATLLKGSISISGEIGNKVFESVVLKPNEQARLTKGNAAISVERMKNDPLAEESIQPGKDKEPQRTPSLHIIKKIDTEPVISWKDQKLVFKSECFNELAKEMERWYNVKIEFQDEELKKARYTGSFDNETIEQAMKALSLSMPFSYTIEKNRIRIYKK
jgi:transmembrane sensor